MMATTQIAAKHAYRPISFYAGRILKYDGFQHTKEGFDTFDAEYKERKGQGYDLGVVWLDEYKGDRINAETHKIFTD